MNEFVLPILIGIIVTIISGIILFHYQRNQDKLQKQTETGDNLQLARYADVLKWGWDFNQLLDALIAIDYEIAPELKESEEGTTSQWAPVFEAHPDCWVLVCKRPKEIVAYWHFATLNSQYFRRAMEGELLEGAITSNTIEPISVGGFYRSGIFNLYLTHFGVLPAHRDNPNAQKELTKSLLDTIKSLALRGIIFREICAHAITPESEIFCRFHDMRPIMHVRGKPLYALSLHPWPQRLQSKDWEEICQIYQHKLGPDPDINA